MMKKGKKKGKTGEYELDAKISPVSRVEIIYEDIKVVIGAEPEFKWGHIYHILVWKRVPEVGLEDLAIYDNILRSNLTKVSTRPENFPCAEVIGWILPRVDATRMIMNNV